MELSAVTVAMYWVVRTWMCKANAVTRKLWVFKSEKWRLQSRLIHFVMIQLENMRFPQGHTCCIPGYCGDKILYGGA